MMVEAEHAEVPSRCEVVIIGAGPAGLTLAHLLDRQGIDTVVLEARSRQYIEQRARAGIVETSVVDLLDAVGLADRLHREATVQEHYDIRFRGDTIRIPLLELTGHVNTLYPQQELVKDLVAARVASGAPLLFDVADVRLEGIDAHTDDDGNGGNGGSSGDGGGPAVRFRHGGRDHVVRCSFVAGADGAHGVCRAVAAGGGLPAPQRTFQIDYGTAWLGILADAVPPAMIGTYCWHPDGFALHSNRGPHTTRQYLEVAGDTRADEWSDERIWTELARRAGADEGFPVTPGPILERTVARLHSYVAEPMRHGRLFLLGDAAHVFPPSGAKGLNVAVGDACVLSRALGQWHADGRTELLDAYSDTCLQRAWQTQRYAHHLTTLLHRLDGDPFRARLQEAELRHLAEDPAARAELARSSTSASRFAPDWAW